MRSSSTRSRALLLAASSLSVLLSSPAAAEAYSPNSVGDEANILFRNDLTRTGTGPNSSLDTGVNGVGQMVTRVSPTTTFLGTCTGTLINPRTVIFAAHCVNTQAANTYGPNGVSTGAWVGTGSGTAMSFGFSADNLSALITWLGLGANPNLALKHNTNTAQALYNVEQVWWDPRSTAPASCTAPGSCFLQADIALATLDTPAFGLPTWAMLFSPLDEPTHAIVTGYGQAGRPLDPPNQNPAVAGMVNADWRRRAVENMVSVLGSFDDRNRWLFNSGSITNNVYMLSFSDPNPAFNPAAGKYDFGIFGDTALTREGVGAPGDSGGPLIIDTKYARKVVAGVLSGSSRFSFVGAPPMPSNAYGSMSFYQPLYLYWDAIVANNPYVYAGNKEGDGDWEDGSHWIQLMDPNYMIDVDGQLVNSLPNTPAQGIAGGGAKFGQICILTSCNPLSGSAADGEGPPLVIAGGPGSTGFVPDNIRANPKNGVNARYFDVTLAAPGTTTLGSSVTIDRMTLDGPTRLDVTKDGSLKVLGAYEQLQGWTNINGTLESGRDMLILTGMLSGSGTVKAPWVTVGNAYVAPGGGDKTGTLTINGNLVLSSYSKLFIDAYRNNADAVVVTGGTGSGTALLGNSVVIFNKVTDKPAPRHGETFTIVSASGGVSGTFSGAYTFQGVLRPELTYTANSVIAELRAGSLVTILEGQDSTAIAFATALDTLRGTSYNNLWNLYGAVDWMNGAQLSAALNGLRPQVLGETTLMQDQQSRDLLAPVSDRLSLLGTGQAEGIAFGAAGLGLAFASPSSLSAGQRLGLSGGSTVVQFAPESGITGFVSGRIGRGRSSYGASSEFAAREGWTMATGLEVPVGSNAYVGTAAGYAEAESAPNGDRSASRTTMAAAYGAMSLGGGAYLGAMFSGETATADIQRTSHDGVSTLRLSGASRSARYTATAEAGFRSDIGRGLGLTPRAQLSYGHYKLSGFTEQGGETALGFRDIAVDRLEARLGAKLDGRTEVAGWSVKPQLRADFVQSLNDRGPTAAVRFAAAPEYSFLLPLGETGGSWAEVGGGVEIERGKFAIGLKGEATTGDTALSDQRAVVDFKVRF